MKIQYYLINGVDRTRDKFMKEQFIKNKIEDVIWIKSHNKDNLSKDFIKKICSNPYGKGCKKGQISCTYKHYLALKNIVENKIDIAVIMEDNIEFKTNNFKNLLNRYLKELPEDWDILFESDTFKYNDSEILKDKIIYKKYKYKNHICSLKYKNYCFCHGHTNAANCYIIPYKTAKKFYDNFLPFPIIIDFYMNYLIQKYNLNTYWVVPPNVHRIRRKSTLQFD